MAEEGRRLSEGEFGQASHQANTRDRCEQVVWRAFSRDCEAVG
jgi:hypothetical protein